MFPTQHENMFLNAGSNIIALILGFLAALVHAQHTSHPILSFHLLTIFTPENIDFIIRSVGGGIIALLVKVGGELLIYLAKSWYEKRKSKGGPAI